MRQIVGSVIAVTVLFIAFLGGFATAGEHFMETNQAPACTCH